MFQRLEVPTILKRSWKLEKKMWMGLSSVQWFAKTIEECLKGNTKDFYTTMKEGNHCFLGKSIGVVVGIDSSSFQKKMRV